MKKRNLFFIALAVQALALSLLPLQAKAQPGQVEVEPTPLIHHMSVPDYYLTAPAILQADFSFLVLQSQLAGFWNSVPRQPVTGFTSIMDAPWSITASGDDWQLWSAASYAWSGNERADNNGETGLAYFSTGLDRSFRDACLLGLSLDFGRYRQSADGFPDAQGNALAGKIYAAARLPLDLELSGFAGLTSFFNDDLSYATNGGLVCWTAGLSLGRTFRLNPFSALRPAVDYEFLLRSKKFSSASGFDSFAQQRGRLGLDFLARIDRLVASAGFFAELRNTTREKRDWAETRWDLYLGARLEFNLLLGPNSELAVQYYGLFGEKRQAHQGGVVLRVFF